jgi:sugar phosphate isomerase/epimerase
MSRQFDRRYFLKTTGAVGAGIGMTGLHGSLLRAAPGAAAAAAHGAPHAEKIGWRLGCQAWSFNRFTLYQAIDKTASLGLHVIEGNDALPLDKKRPGSRLNPSLPANLRKEVKAKLADAGVKLASYGVCPLHKDMAASRQMFDFAKDMGLETLVAEPPEDAFDTLDKLCEEYGVNVAIHDHPKPSHYWNPDTVLKVCQGRSKRIGACCDTGHWLRSGLAPVECLKKLEGRIVSFHFKDLDQSGGELHDVPWGTGKCDAKGMLTEVYRQKIKPIFMIEYEYNWDNSLPDMVQCVAYFDKIAAELSGQ